MKKKILNCLLFLLLLQGVELQASDGVLFNEHWRFYKGDISGGEMPACEDTNWRLLNLPHDWAIEGPFDIKYNARCGGLPFHGTGWYRKTFKAAQAWDGKVVRLAFDGAMSEAKVWVNGHFVGEHPYGYIGFEVDMTPYLRLGEDNVVAVKLTPRDLSSRWYPGAGLYRNVWLRVDEPVHIAQWGIYITTPTVTDKKAVVQIQSTLENRQRKSGIYKLVHSVFDKSGKESAALW